MPIRPSQEQTELNLLSEFPGSPLSSTQIARAVGAARSMGKADARKASSRVHANGDALIGPKTASFTSICKERLCDLFNTLVAQICGFHD